MIVKKIFKEDPISMSEANEILEEIRAGLDPEKEVSYVMRRAIAHAQKFSKIDKDSARKLFEELLLQEKMKPEIAIKIVDILPNTRGELRTIYAKERYNLTQEDLDSILDTVRKYT